MKTNRYHQFEENAYFRKGKQGARRKKSLLRILSAGLALSMLLTGCGPASVAPLTVPGGVEQVEAALQSESGDHETAENTDAVITGFGSLPDEVREQTVPLGTAIEELNLLDTLEAYVAGGDAKNEGGGVKPPEDSGDDKDGQDKPPGEEDGNNGGGTPGGDNGDDIPGDGDNNSGDIPGDGKDDNSNGNENSGMGDNSNDDGKDDGTGDNNGGGNDEGNGGTGSDTPGGDDTSDSGNSGDNGEETSGSAETSGGSESSNGAGGDESSAVENNEETLSTNSGADKDDGTGTDTPETSDSADNRATAGFSIETGSFVMPVYASENPQSGLTAGTLTDETGGTNGQADTREKAVTIGNVTWLSEPAYDGSVEGVYTFTAVLPEGYALSEGVSLPQITVTVGNDITAVIQALLERIAALPDVQEYMEKEPDIDSWEGDEDDYEEAYTEWMEGLQDYAKEALAILEEIEKLTEEEQALLPQEVLEKLAAWAEIAEQLGENAMTMAAHTCSGKTFNAWTSTSSLPTSGNYYLTDNVTLDKSTVYHISGTLNLCLNGKEVIGADRDSKAHIFQIDGGTLNLYDCVGTGRVYGTGTNGFGVIVLGTNGTFNVYGGQTEGGGRNTANVSISGEGGTVRVYGGRVGSIVSGTDKHSSVIVYGGTIGYESDYAIDVKNDSTVTIAGNATFNGNIKTATSVIAQGAGVSGLTNTCYIGYSQVADGTIVVKGSTDSDHYRIMMYDKWALVPEGGNLVARRKYTVTYQTNRGTIADEAKYEIYVHGTGLTLPTPTRPGYTFAGWYTNPDFSGTPVTNISTTDMDDKIYYAKWTGNTYSITYKGLDGADTFTPKPTAHTNGKETKIGNPTRTGYIFAGWTVDDSSTKKTNLTLWDSDTYTEAIRLTAMWWAADSARTVTYVTNGGKISNESNYKTYYEGEGMWLPEPTKSGYVFFGWYENADFSGNKVEKISASDRGNKTYYARWADSFDIRYHQNGGNGSSSGSYTYGTGLKLPTPKRSGYGFFGWYESDDFSGDRVAEISATETGDKEYWALWKKPSGVTTNYTTYLITYHKNGGTMIDKESEFAAYFKDKGLDPLPKQMERKGYEFKGWFNNQDLTGSEMGSIPRKFNQDVVLYAKWTPTPYNITYNLNGGTLLGDQSNPQKYDIESDAMTLINPTKTGYTFAGWSGTDLTGSSNKSVTIAQGSMGNRSYTANWSTDTYTISYNLNGGALQSGQGNPTEYNVESNAITLHNPTKTGYTFAGWSGTGLTGNHNTRVTIAQGCTGNRTYAAEWTPNTYTVTYNGNGSTGGSTADSTHTYGAAKALTANGYKKEYTVTFNHNYTGSSNATKTAVYTFAGWHTNADGTATSYNDKASVSNLTSANNGTVTLYARWTSQSVTYKPTREGYIFEGWYTSSACSGSRADSDGTYTPTGDQTLYACWKETTPPAKPGSSADLPTDWTNTKPTIPLTLSDNEGVKELWVSIDGGDYTKVSDFPGNSQTVTYSYTVSEEGDHTYRFKTKDTAGNESPESEPFRVKLDTTAPVIGTLTYENVTADSADVTFTPSEGGKVYWILDPAGTPADAQEVISGAQDDSQKGGVKAVTGGTSADLAVTGLTPGAVHKVYVVLEDAAGNLSEIKGVSFATLPEAPAITLDDLEKDYEKEKIKVPESFGTVEVYYTDPDDPSGIKIQPPDENGFLTVEPGKPVYIRYPGKTEGDVTVAPSAGVKIDIPGRPAAPPAKEVTVTDTTVKVIGPSAGEEYILVEKGSLPEGAEPDWNDPDKVNDNGAFTDLDPNKEYDLYVRKKATEEDFASESAKTPVRTWVTINEPQITGEGKGKDGNTAPKPDKPDEGGRTVTYTGTYNEEYTPVITIGGKTFIPGADTPDAEGSEMTWDEEDKKGEWKYVYTLPDPDGATEADITVAFRKRGVTGITATPGSLTLSADSDANSSAAEDGETAPLM